VCREVFRPLDFFHILLRYSLILKCIISIFSLINLHTKPHNDKVKQVFRNVLFITNKNRTYDIYISIQNLTQYFDKVPLAEITASSLLGYDATNLAHLYLGSFSHSSLQIPLSSVRLDGES
jgi:hypothetical protein